LSLDVSPLLRLGVWLFDALLCLGIRTFAHEQLPARLEPPSMSE